MASRAMTRAQPADWRAAFRRSLARALQLGGASVLGVATIFLSLSLLSYTQSDPSFSTAAGDAVMNWMGRPGAYAADGVFFLFGLVAILLVPALYATARKLWRDAEDEATPHGRRWWRTLFMLLVAMALLGTAVTLATGNVGNLPASLGGITGLLGADGVRALAGRLPETGQFWAIATAWTGCIALGGYLAGRVFAFDWVRLMTLPDVLRRAPALPGREPNPFKPKRDRRLQRPEAGDELGDAPARKPPEIADTRQPPRP